MSTNHIFVNVGRCLLKYAIYDKYKCKWVYNITLLIYTILQVNKAENPAFGQYYLSMEPQSNP